MQPGAPCIQDLVFCCQVTVSMVLSSAQTGTGLRRAVTFDEMPSSPCLVGGTFRIMPSDSLFDQLRMSHWCRHLLSNWPFGLPSTWVTLATRPPWQRREL